MMTAAAQLLIWSTHTLLDCPNKSLQKTADPSMMRPLWSGTASFDNKGQMTSLQEDDLEEHDVDLLIDPGIQLLKQRGRLQWPRLEPVFGCKMLQL